MFAASLLLEYCGWDGRMLVTSEHPSDRSCIPTEDGRQTEAKQYPLARKDDTRPTNMRSRSQGGLEYDRTWAVYISLYIPMKIFYDRGFDRCKTYHLGRY